MDIRYREAVPEDAGTIVTFYNAVGGETHFLSFEKDEYPLNAEQQALEIRQITSHPTCAMILAIAGEEIAGIGTIRSGDKMKSRHCGELGIVVAKAYQKQGIGTEIMERLITFCRENGISKRIQLELDAGNEVAHELYRRFGFTEEGVLRNATCLNGEYRDIIVMGRLLEGVQE